MYQGIVFGTTLSLIIIALLIFRKLNIERFEFKLETTALTCTDAITYFIHDIKTGKKRWMMLSQIKEMVENNQRIQ